jgi:hypothetical protein
MTDNLNGPEDRRRVSYAGVCCFNYVERPHHPGRKLVDDRNFKACDRGKPRMVGCAFSQIDACSPSFLECIGRCVDHAWEHFDALQFTHRGRWQDDLDRRTQALVVDRVSESPRQADSSLLERHDLQAVAMISGGFQPALPHGMTALNNKGGSSCACHDQFPSRDQLRVGSGVSADATAVFDAMRPIGLREAPVSVFAA